MMNVVIYVFMWNYDPKDRKLDSVQSICMITQKRTLQRQGDQRILHPPKILNVCLHITPFCQDLLESFRASTKILSLYFWKPFHPFAGTIVSLALIISSIIRSPCSTKPGLWECPGLPLTILHVPGQSIIVLFKISFTNSEPLSLCKTDGNSKMMNTRSIRPCVTSLAVFCFQRK